jgi:hypothetical protein
VFGLYFTCSSGYPPAQSQRRRTSIKYLQRLRAHRTPSSSLYGRVCCVYRPTILVVVKMPANVSILQCGISFWDYAAHMRNGTMNGNVHLGNGNGRGFTQKCINTSLSEGSRRKGENRKESGTGSRLAQNTRGITCITTDVTYCEDCTVTRMWEAIYPHPKHSNETTTATFHILSNLHSRYLRWVGIVVKWTINRPK